MTGRVRCRIEVEPDVLDPIIGLRSAIERLRGEQPGRGERVDARRRERLELAARDVVRALVRVRRAAKELEHAGVIALDEVAYLLGTERHATRARGDRCLEAVDPGGSR